MNRMLPDLAKGTLVYIHRSTFDVAPLAQGLLGVLLLDEQRPKGPQPRCFLQVLNGVAETHAWIDRPLVTPVVPDKVAQYHYAYPNLDGLRVGWSQGIAHLGQAWWDWQTWLRSLHYDEDEIPRTFLAMAPRDVMQEHHYSDKHRNQTTALWQKLAAAQSELAGVVLNWLDD